MKATARRTKPQLCMFLLQTYEGGLGGEPGNEAHGGYTFCGLAALMLIDQAHKLDLPALLHFVVRCQVSLPLQISASIS